MTQRKQSLTFKKPSVSYGITDSVLPGGPYQRDAAFRYDVFLVDHSEPPEPIDFTEWTWNEEDTTQFGDIYIISGSTQNPQIHFAEFGVDTLGVGEGNFFIVDSPWGTGNINNLPPLSPPYNERFLRFRVSGSYTGFFIPIADIDIETLRSGFCLEYQIVSASTDVRIGAGFAQEDSPGVISAVGVAHFLGNSINPGTIDKNRASAGSSGPTVANTLTNIYVSQEYFNIPDYESLNDFNPLIKVGSSFIQSVAQLGKVYYYNKNNYGLTTGFLTSSFRSQMFGIWVYNATTAQGVHSVVFSTLRLVRSERSRNLNPDSYPIVNLTAPTINEASIMVSGTISATTGSWTNMDQPLLGLSPYSYNLQWYVGGSPVSGATSFSYTARAEDEGQSVFCRINARNRFHSEFMDTNSLIVNPFSFSPTNLPGLTFWGSGDELVLVNSSSVEVVRQIFNQKTPPTGSALGPLQNTTNSQPLTGVVDGHTTIRFWDPNQNGLRNYLLDGAGGTNYIRGNNHHSWTVFQVHSASLNSASRWVNHRIWGDSNYYGVYVRRDPGDGQHWAYSYTWDSGARTLEFPINLNEVYCLEWWQISGTMYAKINSSSVLMSASTGIGSTAAIARFGDVSSYPFYGDLLEIITCNTASVAEATNLRAYINSKYGVTM